MVITTSNGQFGHRFITSAAASPEGKYYGAIEAWETSVISYDSEIDPEDICLKINYKK